VFAKIRASRTFLIVAVLLALGLRLWWALRFGHAIEQEGAEYARIGENLINGRGYVGIFDNGPQLNFPPLYPILIGVTSLVTRDSEVAARGLAILFGVLLVLPMFAIAEHLYGRTVAKVVALITVLHPVLIAGAASTYAEGPYLTLLVFGLFWLITWVTDRRIVQVIFAGLTFGLAYLVRPEAFVLLGAFAGCIVVVGAWQRSRPMIKAGVALALAFLVVALPNIIFLTATTGKLRIEAKGTLAYQWGSRINAGMSYEESIMGIGDDLSDQGVFMKPNLEVINAPPPTLRQYAAFLFTAAKRNAGDLMNVIVNEHAFGSPFLFALAFLGLFRSAWPPRRLQLESVLVLTLAMTLFVLLTVQALWLRYFYSLLGLLLIWGGKGADELCDWGRATIDAVTGRAAVGNFVGGLLRWTAVGAVLLLALRAIPGVDQFRESRFPERASAGRWIASQSPSRPIVMDNGLQVAFYSGGALRFMPYTTSELALKYIAKKKPDYVVLHSLSKNELPYGAEWFDHGIPDQRATLVHTEGALPQDEIKIYRWTDHAP
jgi:4-amino-4-deoxy-L-arabinose transferase-like glycosyltransferase